MKKKYLISYTDTSDGINTTEIRTFEGERYAEAVTYYNELIADEAPDVYFCDIVMEGKLKSDE